MWKSLLLCLSLYGLLLTHCLADSVDPVETEVLQKLHTQGYVVRHVGKTLLGRLKIAASLQGEEREIIADPHTGAILRDAPEVTFSLFGGWLTFGAWDLAETSDGGDSQTDSGVDNTAGGVAASASSDNGPAAADTADTGPGSATAGSSGNPGQ